MLLAVDAALVLADLTFVYGRLARSSTLRHLLNVAREDSLATWIGSTQCLAAALVLSMVVLARRADGATRRETSGWIALALSFAYIALDDAMELHERVGGAVRRWASTSPGWIAHFPTYYWQLVFGPFFGALALFIVCFTWRRLGPAGLRRWLVTALSCFVVAVGLDLIEGVDGAHDTCAAWLGTSVYAVSHPLKVLEEALELVGTTLFLVTFLRYLAAIADGKRFVVRTTA